VKRAANKGNTRRVIDRSILFARYRWECLRRTGEYEAAVREVIRDTAEVRKCSETDVVSDCLRSGGIVEPVFGDGPAGQQQYQRLCTKYGLGVLIHPDVVFSDDDMAAFPVFEDTPGRQFVVRDPALLKRIARTGGDVDPKTLRAVFVKKSVTPGPFQLAVQRARLPRLDAAFAVFDARMAKTSFSVIATELGMSLDQAKRAWRTARRVIGQWLHFESHLDSCRQCQAYQNRRREMGCAEFERQLGVRVAGRARLRHMPDKQLESVLARKYSTLPAKRATKASTP
jgi:hypothetical protein